MDDGYGNLSGEAADVFLETINFNNEQIIFQDLSEALISFEIVQLNLETNILEVVYNTIPYALELIKIDFENCDILPEKSMVDYSSIMDSLKELLHNSDEKEMEIKISELFILPEEIKNSTSRRLNSSFKNKPKYVKNYSTKNYNFNE